MCSVGVSFYTGVFVKYLSHRCLIQADSGAHPFSTSICTDCSFSYVIKFPLNLNIPKLVLSSDGPQTLLVQVCKQQHFLCATRLWMTLSLIEWGRQKSGASETPIHFCKECWLPHPWRQCSSYSSPFFFFLQSATTYIRFWLAQRLSSNCLYSVPFSSNCVHSYSLYLPKRRFPNVF